MNKPDLPRNALTIDVEDYFHVGNFASTIDRATWGDYPCIAPDATRRLLEMLARHDVKATFFVLGWLAKQYPELVREIAAGGHEVACHGFGHQRVTEMAPAAFRLDVRHARTLLEDLIGAPVVGYRAPSFSILPETAWAIDVLVEEGFAYDSSLYPGRTVPVGFLGADRLPVRIQRAAGSLVELPLTYLEVAGRKLPFSGGGHFRLYPWPVIRAGLRSINQKLGVPFTVFFHPWEIVPDQPRIAAGPSERFRHYVGLRTFERKIERMLSMFAFAPAREVIADAGH